MPDFKEVKSAFPETIWDGTSPTRAASDAASKNIGDGFDRVQQVAEIVQLQKVVKFLAAALDIDLVPPVLTPFATPTIDEFTVTVTIDASTWISGSIKWGDGQTTVIEGGETSFEHVYGEAATYLIEVTATSLIGTSNETFATEVTGGEGSPS